MNITEFAKAAGVSKSAVSRYFRFSYEFSLCRINAFVMLRRS